MLLPALVRRILHVVGGTLGPGKYRSFEMTQYFLGGISRVSKGLGALQDPNVARDHIQLLYLSLTNTDPPRPYLPLILLFLHHGNNGARQIQKRRGVGK